MRSRPCLLPVAGTALVLSSLALTVSGPVRADHLIPSYLYQFVASSASQLRVLAANASSVLVREIGPAGESLADYPLNGGTPRIIARAGGPFPGGGLFPPNAQFTQATLDLNGAAVFRAFSAVDASTWNTATAIYFSGTQQSVALQSFLPVTQAVKTQLDQPFDSSGQYSVRTTAFADGSGTTARWLNDQNGETGIVLETGDKIAGATTTGESVKTVGAPRIDFQNNIFVPVGSDRGTSYLLRYTLVHDAPSANRWQQSGAARFPAGFLFQQVALSKTHPDQMLILGMLPGAQIFSLWAVDWKQPNPTAAPVSASGPLGTLGLLVSISDLSGGATGEFHVAVETNDMGGKAVRDHVLSFDPGSPGPTISSGEILFYANQATPQGRATEINDALAAFGIRSTAFAVSLPAGGGIVAASPIPAPGVVPVRTGARVTYTAAGGAPFDWTFSGSGTLTWGSTAQQPDGTVALPFELDAFRMTFAEPDGTPWSLFGTGPAAGQVLLPPDHFGRPTGSVKLRPGVTVGQRVFPIGTWFAAVSLDPVAGAVTFDAAGPNRIGTDIFGAGDLAELKTFQISDSNAVFDRTSSSPGTTTTTTETYDPQGIKTGKAVVDRTDDGKGNRTTTTATYDLQGNKTGTTIIVETNDGQGTKTAATTWYDAQGHDTGKSVVDEVDNGNGTTTTTTTTYDSQDHETGKSVVTQ